MNIIFENINSQSGGKVFIPFGNLEMNYYLYHTQMTETFFCVVYYVLL